MSCDPFKLSMMAKIDGELGRDEEAALQAHLAACSPCREELASHQRIKEMTSFLRLRQPEDRDWEQYWSRIHNRLERNLAWIFVSAGAVLLAGFLTFWLLEQFVLSAAVPWALRLGGTLLIAGLLLLFVSVWRERWSLRKTDRYEGIIR